MNQQLPSKHPLLNRKGPGPYPGSIISSPISPSYQIPMNVPYRHQPFPQGIPQSIPQQFIPQASPGYIQGPNLTTLSPPRQIAGGQLLSSSPGSIKGGIIAPGPLMSSPGFLPQAGVSVASGISLPNAGNPAGDSLDDRFLRCIQRSEFLVQTNRHILDRSNAQKQEDRSNLSLNELFERAIQRSTQTINRYSANSANLTNTLNNHPKRRNSSSDEEKIKRKAREEEPSSVLKSEILKGDRYEGETADGKRHGRGVYYYSNGDYYEGSWVDDKKNGSGELKAPNGRIIYRGEWKNDKFDGKGVWYNLFPDDFRTEFNYNDFDDLENKWASYEGEFRDGKFDGEGILSLNNREVFRGRFNLGMIEGEGSYQNLKGEMVIGIWKENRLEQRL